MYYVVCAMYYVKCITTFWLVASITSYNYSKEVVEIEMNDLLSRWNELIKITWVKAALIALKLRISDQYYRDALLLRIAVNVIDFKL